MFMIEAVVAAVYAFVPPKHFLFFAKYFFCV